MVRKAGKLEPIIKPDERNGKSWYEKYVPGHNFSGSLSNDATIVGLNYKNVIIGETVWFVSVHLGRTKK